MNCVICQRTIKPNEPRTYSVVGRRRIYACKECQDAFDAYLDFDGNVLIRIKSHRAREKAEGILGKLPQEYHSFFFDGEFRYVPQSSLNDLLAIKGITRARVDETKLRRCWDIEVVGHFKS